MYKLKSFTKCILKMIYNSLILPFLYYGILAWGNAYEIHVMKVILLQKRAIRIICHTSYLAHTHPLFKEIKILNFNDMYNYQCAIFLFTSRL